MALLDFLKFNKTVDEPVETRSDTLGGPVVLNWDSAYGYGRNIDRLSVVYGCINLRASTVASLPIQLNRKLNRGHEPAKDHEYYDLITKRPNGFQTNYTFWHWVITQVDMFGNVYIQKIRNNAGTVIEMFPLNPISVEVFMSSDGMPYYKMNITGVDGVNYYKEFSYDQIIHIKGYSRNGVYGLSLIDTFRTLYDGYLELENAGTAIAKNAAKPAGVVYYPGNMKEEELEKMKSGWKAGFTSGNSGKTAFLPNTIKVETPTVGLTAQQAEYIQQKQFSAQRIAADIFRVPLHMLGLTNAPTYSSIEQQAIEFVQYTITPLVTNIEQQIQKQLLDDAEDVYINFNVNGLLRGDIKTRMEWYRFGIEHGILTPNDVNEAEDTGLFIPAEKGGDDYIRPLNFTVIGAAPIQSTAAPAISPLSASIEGRSCPVETQDIGANLANRQKAINVAHYGPANPQLPNEEYWMAKAKQFNTNISEARTMRCANCAAFNVSKRMKDCINTGIGADANEVQAQVGELGYCELFDFKCAGSRTCDAWLTGGPIRNENSDSLANNEVSSSVAISSPI